MQSANQEATDAPRVHDYCIGQGGLLRRFEVATHLTQLHWQLVALLGVTWCPLVILGLTVTKQDALVYDSAVHVRLLVVAPVLLILDQQFPQVCSYTLSQLQAQSFVQAAAQPRVDQMLRRAARWADSSVAEMLIALLALGLGLAALRGVVPLRGLARGFALAPDRLWFALSDLPLFHFLLWRSVWRWVVWVVILFGLARTELDVVPTHPDRCGGLRFLTLPSSVYCSMLLFAISSVLCAEWETRQTLGATLQTFSPLLFLLGVAGALLAFGPLLTFGPQLYRARKRGLLELGAYATRRGRQLCAALLDPASSVEPETIQLMANTEQTYRETVNQLSVFLVQKKDLLHLLVAALLPVVPIMFRHVPNEDWWVLGKLITGWKP